MYSLIQRYMTSIHKESSAVNTLFSIFNQHHEFVVQTVVYWAVSSELINLTAHWTLVQRPLWFLKTL